MSPGLGGCLTLVEARVSCIPSATRYSCGTAGGLAYELHRNNPL